MQAVMPGDETNHLEKIRRSENGMARLAVPILRAQRVQYRKRFAPRIVELPQCLCAILVQVITLTRPHTRIGARDERLLPPVEQTDLCVMHFALGIAQVTDQLRSMRREWRT